MSKMPPKQIVRKPAISRVRNMERKKLVWQGNARVLNDRIAQANIELSNIDKSTSRLKITKQVQLQKSIARWTNSLTKVNDRLKKVDDKLKGYTTIIW